MTNREFPLVSIIVITYNSSAYVLETLESAKAQTYKNIELIISDDCSKDNTVSVCEKWLEKNKTYFKNSKLIAAKKNKGIPGNCNQGLRNSQGEWIKLIAGDDKLLPDGILNYVEFVSKHSNSFVFAFPQFYNEWNDNEYNQKQEARLTNNSDFFTLSAKDQFLHLLIKPYPINPPTIFFRRSTLLSMDGFDENFINEDFPLYLKATYQGNQLRLLKKKTIIYRVHEGSISQKMEKNIAISFWRKIKMRTAIRKYISWSLFFSHPLIVIDYLNQRLIDESVIFLGNKKSIYNVLKLGRFLSPLYSFDFFNRKFLNRL